MTTSKAQATQATARTEHAAADTTGALERPIPAGSNAAGFGSDVVAETLRALDIPYIALNPGASYRGLHDSLVNFLGNKSPQMLLCLHEEAAVAIAHGYAKVTGKAMAAAVHSNVGLMHATMAMFNAWCDRMPVVVLGATGPVDAAKRRPWIDWIHTTRDQGALVRDFTKWDDQPASPAAAREALLRAAWIANTTPKGPVYVNLDAEMQEAKLTEELPPIDVSRFMPQADSAAPADLLRKAVDLLRGAKRPIILSGRASRDIEAWNARVALAETLNARVLTDLKIGASFPTTHPLHAGVPNIMPADAIKTLQDADVVLSLDWVDLAGVLRATGLSGAKVIHVSLDHRIHKGWNMDYQALPPVDVLLAAVPEIVVPDLLTALGGPKAAKAAAPARPAAAPQLAPDRLTTEHLARALHGVVGGRPTSLLHIPLSWDDKWWPFEHPLDYLGSDGGGGVGGGPGMSVGAALALKGSGRLPVAICGDGDFLMGCTAVWTAAHYRIPLLFVVSNNRSFFNDEVHQERVARMRHRPVENRWIGQRMSDPEVDVAGIARAQGARGFGPITRSDDLPAVFAEAIKAVDNGEVAVVDVRVEPGYTPIMMAAMTRSKAD
ncbi:MAG TPA: thiamine pyrophosphate-binding protein [Xanthobacteraceae bacterium]|nr:thiamine pyrophosphate-binding protein [Xanthobacteraceae bacterium]